LRSPSYSGCFIEKFISLRVGGYLVNENRGRNLSGSFDLLSEQDRAAADKDRFAGAQVEHPFTQLAEQVVNENLG